MSPREHARQVDKLTSMTFNEPNKEISLWISTISLFHAFSTLRSCCSNHVADSLPDFLRGDSGSGGSLGRRARGSGMTPRWTSKSADGMHAREREEMLRLPRMI